MGLCVSLHTRSGGIKTFTLYTTSRSIRDQICSRFMVGSSIRYLLGTLHTFMSIVLCLYTLTHAEISRLPPQT